MRLLFVADLHGDRWKYKRLLDAAKDSRADVVINGGDMLPWNDDLRIFDQLFEETCNKYPFSVCLAIAGTAASFEALKRRQVDALVLLKGYSPPQIWTCATCDLIHPEQKRPGECPECGGAVLKEIDIKEEMVRITQKQGCQVEVVNESEALSALGGVGCLLRYCLQDEYA